MCRKRDNEHHQVLTSEYHGAYTAIFRALFVLFCGTCNMHIDFTMWLELLDTPSSSGPDQRKLHRRLYID